ncbi:Crp/Fnr family transcriptional regulator [Phaeodactylibacter sp.]|jgi:CRP-like cAMP-binding protein|uniref:Crp/Fnr family transcriptional regulator n=1 Tax=Phaeodactylibacter sp. TaxID=1940289 RepID=UPI0025F8E2E4|nr:Crp/Fnr family transcriptional regulator [Phaeodactylibacter sp.]MCI4647231.1 Crp/Fnr family transcriptional regulator [Phaeodactylibacter sp.]MCI5093956.1 Crp/Fnr family transcriptional regulator [Phaeodactylibacter sp.]
MNAIQEIFLKMFSRFPEEAIIQFANAFSEKKLKKGDFLLQEGQICRDLVFILNGNMMCYYLKDGKRYIDEFSLDYEFITDYTSFIYQSTTDKYIECLEDCVIYTLSYERMNALYDLPHQPFDRLGRMMAEQIYLQWHEKSKSLLMDDATERYLKLINKRPYLSQRVPQYLIAEYLGIAPESLSRIRKSLTNTKV